MRNELGTDGPSPRNMGPSVSYLTIIHTTVTLPDTEVFNSMYLQMMFLKDA